MDFINEYVGNLEMDQSGKEKILKTISKLYSVVQQKDLEEKL